MSQCRRFFAAFRRSPDPRTPAPSDRHLPEPATVSEVDQGTAATDLFAAVTGRRKQRPVVRAGPLLPEAATI
jgi:hypothetical protein